MPTPTASKTPIESTMCKATEQVFSVADKRRSLHAPIEQDGKGMAAIPTALFFAVCGIILPIWTTTILPLTIIYQLAKSVYTKVQSILSNDKQQEEQFSKDSGYQVNPKDIIPRSERKYDIVLLGSTGFTGYLMCRHLIRTYGCNGSVKWAIAGRNQMKLNQLKERLAKELDAPEAMELDTIIVDTSVTENLPALVKNTRAVVTTAGPFSLYGSYVVEFCSKFGTHYADITGETTWVKTMINKWQSTAQQTGAKLIHFCGNDCVPWDLTVFKAMEKITEEGLDGEQLESISIIDECTGDVSGGTIHTMSLGMAGKLPPTPKADPFQLSTDGKAIDIPAMINNLSWGISKSQTPVESTNGIHITVRHGCGELRSSWLVAGFVWTFQDPCGIFRVTNIT